MSKNESSSLKGMKLFLVTDQLAENKSKAPLSTLAPVLTQLEGDIRRRIELTRSCMKALDRNIQYGAPTSACRPRSDYTIHTYILPTLLYGVDTWSMTKESSWRIDAFDHWCLYAVRIQYRLMSLMKR